MKDILSNMLANDLLEMEQQKWKETVDTVQTSFNTFRDQKLAVVVNELCKFMGTPPQTDIIKLHVDTPHTGVRNEVPYVPIEMKTPQHFFARINQLTGIANIDGVNKEIRPVDVDDLIQIINDPRNDERADSHLSQDKTWYTTTYQEYHTHPNLLYNLKEMDLIAQLVLTSLKTGRPVWFACNMNTDVDPMRQGMAKDLYRPDLFTKYKSGMSKADRMKYGLAHCNHAMLIVGAETAKSDNPNDPDQVIAFRIENSWGDSGPHGGFYKMTIDWFKARVYTVVIHEEILSLTLGDSYKKPTKDQKLEVIGWKDFFG
jgi:aminopeptidase C